MSFLHAKEEVDATTREKWVDAGIQLDACIASLRGVVECVDLAREMGDFDFGKSGYPCYACTNARDERNREKGCTWERVETVYNQSLVR